jgi:hypothetical protein
MKTIFQKGNINESQILELNYNALKTIGRNEQFNQYKAMNQTPNANNDEGVNKNKTKNEHFIVTDQEAGHYG